MIKREPPFICCFCGENNKQLFTKKEHIVPESLGNTLLVLPKGWICDRCNNEFSVIEHIVLEKTVLAVERCRLGVVTKKGKPSKARTGQINWEAIPDNPNQVKASILNKSPSAYTNGEYLCIEIPVIDQNTKYLSLFLLKIGLELCFVVFRDDDIDRFIEAKEYIKNQTSITWNYLTIINDDLSKILINGFIDIPEFAKKLKQQNIQLALQYFDSDIIMFFIFGRFKAAVNLTSRNMKYAHDLETLGVSSIVC